MRITRHLGLLVSAVALAGVAWSAPAQASPGNGWGWGQLQLSSSSVEETAAIRATLLESIPAGITQARLDALAPLVKSGALTQDQAALIAHVHNASVISALRKSGRITSATAVLVHKALAGTNGVPAKRAAAKIAIDQLVRSGLIAADQAAAIRNSLGL